MKKIFILILAIISLSQVTNAQLYVDSLGIVQVGNYEHDIFAGRESWSKDTSIIFSIKGNGYFWSGAKLTLGDASSSYSQNVSIGEVKNGDGDTDQLWLHGKKGLYYTAANRSQDTIFYYDTDRGNYLNVNCSIRATKFTIASDSRFKDDIKPLENSLASITSLSPVSYKLKPRFGMNANDGKGVANDRPAGALTEKEIKDVEYFDKFHQSLENVTPQFGFIAQEVKEIFPELVQTDKDGYMYVDYISMIPLLVKAIGELNAQVEELKAENDELNNQMQHPKVVGSSELEDELIKNALHQNVPNPFTTSTTIRMMLRNDVAKADVYIFDMQGNMLKCIPVNDRGNATITIEGGELNAGMYIYSLVADGKEVASKRMILTK